MVQFIMFGYITAAELLLRCIYTALLFVPVFICSFMLRGRRPYLQLALWSVVLLRAVLPSNFSLPFSLRELLAPIGVEPFSSMTQSVSCVVMALCTDTPLVIPGVSNRVSLTIIAATWACVALALLCRFIVHRCFYSRLLRRAEITIDAGLNGAVRKWREMLGVSRHVELYIGDTSLPFTMGLWRPKIYLPRAVAANAGMTDVVIGHEMAHIRRYDDLWVCICGAINAMYFFFPPVRYALKQVALQRERICDQLVVARGNVDASSYAHHLLAACNEAGVRGCSVAGLSARATIYSSRITAIAEASRQGIRGVPLALFMLAAAFLFVMPMAPTLSPRQSASPAIAVPPFTAPLMHYEVGALFGEIQSTPVLGRRSHNGVDLIALPGSSVVSMADGVVVQRVMRSQVRNNGGYGNFLLIRHGEYLVYYTDLTNLRVKEGDTVRRGQFLGMLDGNQRYRTRPRLHVEVVHNKASIDPLPLIDSHPTRAADFP